jgi:hypothetical protein
VGGSGERPEVAIGVLYCRKSVGMGNGDWGLRQPAPIILLDFNKKKTSFGGMEGEWRKLNLPTIKRRKLSSIEQLYLLYGIQSLFFESSKLVDDLCSGSRL